MKNILWVAMTLIAATVTAQDPKMKAGKAHLDNENYAAARTSFQEVIAKDAKAGDAYYYIGESYYAEEKYDSAYAWYRRGLDGNDRCASCQTGIGKEMLDKKNVEEARKAFELALRYTRSKNPETFAQIGLAYLSSKNAMPADAVLNYTKARDLDVQSPTYSTQLGDAHLANKNLGEAMNSYERAFTKDPNNVEVLMKMARIWRGSNKDRAIENLEKAISLDPNYALAYKELIGVYGDQKRYDKITPLLDKYVSLVGSDDPDAIARLAKFLIFQAKDYDRGISFAKKALELKSSNYYQMYRWLAWGYYEKGDYATSLENSKQFFSTVGDRTIIWTDHDFYAKALEKTGDLKGAEEQYLKVIDVDSSRSKDLYDYLVKMYVDAKDDAGQIRCIGYKQAKGIASTTDLTYLARAYYTAKDYARADTIFAEVCQKSPTYCYAYNMRAKCAANLDNDDTPAYLAKPHYEAIIKIYADGKGKDDPQNKGYLSDAHYYLGIYQLNALNDKVAALASFEEALKANPNNAGAAEAKTAVAGQ